MKPQFFDPLFPSECPSCKSLLRYTAIVQHPTGAKKETFSRAIGIYSIQTDRTVAYKCPDCDHEWPRHPIEKE